MSSLVYLRYPGLTAAGPVNAGDLIGTTLAPNVVNSSLTKVGILESLSVAGETISESFAGNGALLTDLDGGSISTGIVAPMRLGTGLDLEDLVLNAGSLLHGDGTWSPLLPSDIVAGLQFTPLNKAGDIALGDIVLFRDPILPLGAATKQYVDNVASGMNVHYACRTATTVGLGATYAGNTLTGVGAMPTINGVTLVVGDRVLVKDQAEQRHNGIYVVTTITGNWVMTRAADFDNSPNNNEIVAGAATYIQEGGLAGTQWVQTTPGPIAVGSSLIVWSQFGGPGSLIGGDGISVNSNTVTNTGVRSLTGTVNQVAVSSSTGAVTLSLPSSVTISGNFTAASLTGSGANITALNGSNVSTGTVAPARLGAGTPSTSTYLRGDGRWEPATAVVNANALLGTTIAANVVSSSLTSVGTLSSLTLSGSLTFGTNYTEKSTALTSFSGGVTVNCSAGNVFVITLSSSTSAMILSGVPPSGTVYSMTLIFNQTGAFTWPWPASFKWANGIVPVVTNVAGKTDVFTAFTYDGGNTWLAFAAGQNM